MGSNVFNAFVPFYTQVNDTPAYLRDTGAQVTTENFYWANRLIGALADAHFSRCASPIERYQNRVQAQGQRMLREFDRAFAENAPADAAAWQEDCNRQLADMARQETDKVLAQVLYQASMEMKNGFSRSDA